MYLRLASLVPVLVALATTTSADDKPDTSTKVTAAVSLPKTLATFTGRTLELRLYEYDPRLADAPSKLIQKIAKPGFAHTKGKPTVTKIVIGAKGTINPRRSYYLTMFVLNGKRRTHIGEKDGKRGLCKVLTNGQPRNVKVIVRSIR